MRTKLFQKTAAASAARTLTVLAALSAGSAALAQQAPFELGTLVVTGARSQVGEVGSEQVASLVTRSQMQQANRDNVGDALDLLSGVTLSNNSRNEKTIAVRGFDARQVPLFVDGIPVYVPYDGYVDFNRFTTADLAAIQVAKGFASMAYGANTLGGAINLISRKPKAVLEADASLGYAAGIERQANANIGTNQGAWYLQAGASYVQSDSYPLSSAFRATPSEDGGARNNAYRKDDKLSLKVGLTPGGGDEYALSYYRQDGVKGQPPSTDPAVARYWKWPYWNKESLYFISRTALGASETLKLRLYHDSYDNEIDSYTNDSYSVLKTSGSGSVSTGRSIYNDRSDGASLEFESRRWQAQTLRLLAQYKVDEHTERDANALVNTHFKDTLVSYALEDNLALAPAMLLALGIGQSQLRPDTVFSTGNAYSLPDTKTAHNAQAGLFYDLTPAARLYASVAHKTRLPTLKDRYSQRLGTYVENPALAPETSVNYELGYQGQPWHGAKAEAALFYSDIRDKIQSAFIGTVASSCAASAKCQMRNIGQVHASGIELSLGAPLAGRFEAGANYTLTRLENVSDPATRLIDVPRTKITARLQYRASDALDVSAFGEYNSSRWSSNTIQLGGFATLNLKASYKAARQLGLEAGVSNLADKNYALADGFPAAGRMWFAKANYQY